MKSFRLFTLTFIYRCLPLTRCFSIKRALLRWAGATVGENVRCVSSASFALSGPLSIGRGTWIGHEVLLAGGTAEVVIGENCDIGPRVSFITGTHAIATDGVRAAGAGYSLPVVIGSGCWIGAGVTILGGTTIGECAVVAAGAVLRGDYPGGCLIGGVPARVIRPSLKANRPT